VNELPPAFEFRKITKAFDSYLANDNVSFQVQSNGLHGVVGENGAGKSTIMKILYGLYQPDAGEIWIRGKRTVIQNPQRAIQLGIGMVHQHFMLVPTIPVWQNIILGKEPSPFLLDSRRVQAQLSELQTNYGFSLDLAAPTESLPVGQQQQVEILKLLYREAEILILDEPTAVLTPQEVDALFEKLKGLWSKGKTIVLISHKLREILSFTETITVMRRGQVVESVKTQGLNEADLGQKIVGRQIHPLPERRTLRESPLVLKVSGLTLVRDHKPRLQQISFEVRAGEILGVAGVTGNGQDELLEVLANVSQDYEGSVTLNGKELKEVSTYEIKQKGLSVIPSDRLREGLVLNFSVLENFLLGHHREPKFTKGPCLSKARTLTQIRPLMEAFDIRPRNPAIPVRALSGGNQQKVIIARELSHEVKLLVAAYPTRGVDIGACESIHSTFLKYRDEGAAVVLVSSELDEVLSLSDRILVLFEGRITGETIRSSATESQLGLWMMGAGGA
jgi:general nucleoside transport system ATP-binding protein